MYLHKIIVWICILLLLTGCLEKRILDDINIQTLQAFDVGEKDGDLLVTAVVPIYQADKTISNEAFSAYAQLNKDAVRELQKKSSDPIVTGSLEFVLYSEEIARQGIKDLFDALQRDASIGTGLYLAVNEGRALDMVKLDFGNRGTGAYFYNLVEHNVEQRDLPITNLHVFLNDYYKDGKDPTLPLLMHEGNKILIKGVAIFDGDKMVSMIPSEKLFYLKILVDEYVNGIYSTLLPGGEYVSIYSVNSNRTFRVTWEGDTPTINIHLAVDGVLKEYGGEDIADDERAKEIQENISDKLISESMNLIKQFQEIGVDPLGLGYEVKTRKRGFDIKKWEDQTYPNVEVNVTSNVRIIGTGIVE
ncbi:MULTISPECIES: Ger(x)C family spore germination protein [Bacillus]|uniref:Ger(x)C family spore germination protein n=1 Tax=Bacillus TaxID=1386 RepID=UPI000BB8F427|nr:MULTISPECIES: Ger(x)C family spore germination protein [Bacillus]